MDKVIKFNEDDHKSLTLWATDCAEHVLPYFETEYLEDNRPRKAIEAGRAWAHGEMTISEARIAAFAAHAAARSANHICRSCPLHVQLVTLPPLLM